MNQRRKERTRFVTLVMTEAVMCGETVTELTVTELTVTELTVTHVPVTCLTVANLMVANMSQESQVFQRRELTKPSSGFEGCHTIQRCSVKGEVEQ